MDSIPATPPIPAHVPAALVRDVDPLELLAQGGQYCHRQLVDIHRDYPPVFWATRFGYFDGCWVVQQAEDLRYILQTPEIFSSSGLTGFSALLGESWPLIPLELDPPTHAAFRAVINPLFTPRKMADMEGRIRDIAQTLLVQARSTPACDFNEAFAIPFPVMIFLELMGWPQDQASTFVGWAKALIKTSDIQQAAVAAGAIAAYLRGKIAAAKLAPSTDFCSYALSVDVNGRKMTDDEILGMCFLVFIAGLDTVTSALGFQFLHLATHPQDQQFLRANPGQIPEALEELLRAYPIVSGRRRVLRDVEIGGVSMRAGDFVVVSSLLANSDAREFPQPEMIDFKREDKRHMTFAFGPHRCAGSNLARRELNIALEVWLAQSAHFTQVRADELIVRPAGVMGLDNLFLSIAAPEPRPTVG